MKSLTLSGRLPVGFAARLVAATSAPALRSVVDPQFRDTFTHRLHIPRIPGPGYRVYFTKRGQELIVLLAGGDKSTQSEDIRAALQLARNL